MSAEQEAAAVADRMQRAVAIVSAMCADVDAAGGDDRPFTLCRQVVGEIAEEDGTSWPLIQGLAFLSYCLVRTLEENGVPAERTLRYYGTAAARGE